MTKTVIDWLEYLNKGLCGLCGNSGVVNTIGVKSAAGVPCGINRYCVCPNGRAHKKAGTLASGELV